MEKKYLWAIMVFTLLIFSGCGKEEEEKLKICIDATKQAEMEILVNDWKVMEEGADIELIVIPTEKNEAELKLSELRTEVMAGEGPDIFLLECIQPEQEGTHDSLFVDLEKSMETGLFLPLDEYIENAKYIDISDWNKTVLDAGKTEEGQVVLPLYYCMSAYVFKNGDLAEKEAPSSWGEFIASEDPVLKNAVKGHSFSYFTYSFGNLADYQTGELVFSQEELKSYLEEFLVFEEELNAQDDTQNLSAPVAGGWANGDFFYKEAGKAVEEEKTCVSIPNREGSVTAMVTMFAAVNKNTTKAEEAFSFLGFILSDEVTSGIGFVKDGKHCGDGIDLNPYQQGITVNQKVFKERYCKNDKVKTIFEILNNRIEYVRFYSVLDKDLYKLHNDFRVMYYMNEDISDIDQLIKTTYDTMKMRLAE